MGRARVALDLPGSPEGAEVLWHDLSRWPSFVDGFGHVAKVEDGWPAAGGRLVWDSRPGGRGRVVERVTACDTGRGQTAEVEDERLRGTQTIAFAPLQRPDDHATPAMTSTQTAGAPNFFDRDIAGGSPPPRTESSK